MAIYNLPVDVCSACRESHYEKGKEVQCDIDSICVKTHNFIDDPDEIMELSEREKDVLFLWSSIVSLSKFEQIKKQSSNKKDVDTFYLKTLEKMELVLDNTDFNVLSITKKDAIRYIQAFHTTYNNILLG